MKKFFSISATIGTLFGLKLGVISIHETGKTNLSALVSSATIEKTIDLRKGENIFSIDLVEVEKKILKEFPLVESVRLHRSLPDSLEIDYSIKRARALGLRDKQLWIIDSHGGWVAPLSSLVALDLPLISGQEEVGTAIQWLDVLEKELSEYFPTVHEITIHRDRFTALVDFNKTKTRIEISGEPHQEIIIRLKKAVQYLIKNNILVSRLDLRLGKKVVVNVGISP